MPPASSQITLQTMKEARQPSSRQRKEREKKEGTEKEGRRKVKRVRRRRVKRRRKERRRVVKKATLLMAAMMRKVLRWYPLVLCLEWKKPLRPTKKSGNTETREKTSNRNTMQNS